MNDKNSNTQTEQVSRQRNEIVDDEIDLLELVKAVWRGKWIIIVITAVFSFAAVGYALSLPDIYRAEAQLAPTKESQGAAMGALGGQLGGLASLAGINMPQGAVDNSRMAQEIIKSRAFISDFVQRRGILPDLMAVESWNPDTRELEYDNTVYNPSEELWVRDVKAPSKPEPSSWEYVSEFRALLQLDVDTTTSLIKLGLEHRSPDIAKQWVDWLIEDINNEMRRRDIEEARSSIAYIERELENARLANTQQVYASMLEQQTQVIMLANVRPEYVFRVIDPAVSPEERVKPKRSIIAIVGALLGAIFSTLLVLVISAFRRKD